jgi:uncharacterized protein
LKRYIKYLTWFFLISGICVGFYASLVEPFRLVITEWTVTDEKWNYPKPLKIVLLADPHAIYPWMSQNHLEKIVQETNNLNPDIVLLLGDYVATHPFGKQLTPEEGVGPYQKIKSTCGVFAILGNHDLHGSEGWPEALEKTGIPILRNEVKKIKCANQSFWIAGLDEWWYGHPDINQVLEKITNTAPVILMTHNPDAFAELPDKFVLTVAGHTHGGQIRLPFYGAIPFVVPSDYGVKYVYGHVTEQGKDLIVSGGLGMTGLPLRFLMPPEITVVNLKN